MEAVLTLWRDRSDRERLLLSVLGVLLVGTAYWFLLVAPAAAHRRDAHERYVASVKTLAEVQAAARQVSGVAAAPKRVDLRNTIVETAGARQLGIQRLQPEGDGTLTVWLEPATPAQVFGWVADLGETHGIEVRRATIGKAGDGVVAAQATFAQAAS